MYLTTKTLSDNAINSSDALDLDWDAATSKFDQVLSANSTQIGRQFYDHQSESWIEGLDQHWRCVASDYSVQYKRMPNRFEPLHSNNLSIDVQKLTTVDDCKVADFTRCSYEIQEGQCIRVSVHAKLVFKQ